MVGCHLAKAVIPGREGVKGLAPEGETTEFARENRAKLMQLAIHLGFLIANQQSIHLQGRQIC